MQKCEQLICYYIVPTITDYAVKYDPIAKQVHIRLYLVYSLGYISSIT